MFSKDAGTLERLPLRTIVLGQGETGLRLDVCLTRSLSCSSLYSNVLVTTGNTFRHLNSCQTIRGRNCSRVSSRACNTARTPKSSLRLSTSEPWAFFRKPRPRSSRYGGSMMWAICWASALSIPARHECSTQCLPSMVSKDYSNNRNIVILDPFPHEEKAQGDSVACQSESGLLHTWFTFSHFCILLTT